MKKIFAAAALLLAMTACGGSQKKALPLEGTTWKLAKMEAIPAKAIDAEADFFTLQFSAADTLVSGRTNCNRFFGKYELKGQKLEFENLGMTRMACPEMQYEDAFVKMLDEVDGYEIKGEELKFYDDKKLLAEFRAVRTLRLKRNKSYPGLNGKNPGFRVSEAGFSSFCRDPRPPSYAGCHSPEAIPASSRSKNSRSGIP